MLCVPETHLKPSLLAITFGSGLGFEGRATPDVGRFGFEGVCIAVVKPRPCTVVVEKSS